MRAVFTKFIAVLLSVGVMALAGEAMACNTGCAPPPPPTPPTNPNPPCGGGGCGGHGGGKTNVNVNVNVRAGAFGSASAGSTSYGGGYGNWSQTPGYPQAAGSLNVLTDDASAFEAYSETQSFTRQTIIQASCIDDTGVPHPASQVFNGRDIANNYRGEVYRCIAGTHMQWTFADYDGQKINFDGGKNMTCAKGDALWFEGGELTCRPQTPQRQCNERSLLRRFGVGIKILTLTRTETITKQRQIAAARSTSSATVMSFDGGVGGFVQ
ncbi:hypothetical protein [Asticcacaulis sp. AC466]|uniref:hypothetical protein n=1 Tax=Asticcacaulis sp. AC466 TaxID=1282362 RepID=UPI0004CF6E51|nr:hypothetical protein [Asticcacaulis sp. AC466]